MISSAPQTVKSWLDKFQVKTAAKPPETSSGSAKSRRRKQKQETKKCPVCQKKHNVNFISSIKHWYCVQCDTEFDRNNVIYIYDDNGELIEVISDKPGIWDHLKLGKTKKGIIMTLTV
ncbi:hypothetical protein [Paenibacillus sp. J2TS4]|uniref:hypothetical protein n=1 Tax=Paenibacillus sp. J2TS4 TaxID=2807194 RepID=UPI001B08F949|nr:hypothetical protein [Paenibacillus sp. J2TS4]GIP34769.1 hypothetical protein J2TS4_39790 [Paenibacillus sp. J2TS4]